MSISSDVAAIFTNHLTQAQNMTNQAAAGVQAAFAAFASIEPYTAYEWQSGSPPVIGYNPTFPTPGKPALGALQGNPALAPYPAVGTIAKGSVPSLTATKPSFTYPTAPSGEPSDSTGTVPRMSTLSIPPKPNMYPLPAATLPYTTLNLPPHPVWTDPIFNAKPPEDITSITLEEYLAMLTQAFAEYADTIPRLVQGHWLEWYRAMLGENPLIKKIEGILSSYYDTGGAGIPVPIEEAIITRATDRTTAEYQRAEALVFESAARRGMHLPSGSLLAGIKEARQTKAEAVAKVTTDTAIKNLELEHDYMKFMLQLGVDFEKMLLGFAGDLAKTVTDLNGQAIEMTKQILTGMLGINDAIIKIYTAKWQGYVSAVEAYKAMWQGIEMKIRVYEAEIKAELAKTEIDKAYVEVLTAMVGANTALANMYKTQVEAETAKLEGDKIAIQGYQAAVQAYVAKIEAYKARWQGFAAANEGQVARAKAYEAEVQGYVAQVNGYKAGIEGEAEVIKATGVHIDAVGKQNEQSLKAWQIQLDGTIRAYTGQMEGYKAEWQAVSEQLRGYAEGTRILADALFRGYTSQTQMDIEKAHQHLAEWRSSMEGAINGAKGVTEAAGVASSLAGSALTGLTSFAGALATGTGAAA
jgi:hypothetical protein